MKSTEQRIENQVQFWSMIGPFILLLSIAILLYKLSAHWYFPISALVGIPLCVKWKMKGMAAALGFLFLLSLVSYQTVDLDERYWHVGMGLAMAFSFIILTLSLEEVENLVSKLQRESQSRLDNFLRLDETTKKSEELWLDEKGHLTDRIAVIAKDLSKVTEDKQIFYKLAQLAKDELIQIRDQHHLLQQELFYKKQQIAQLTERLEESELMVQSFVNSDAEQRIIALSRQIEEGTVCQEVQQEKINHLQTQMKIQKETFEELAKQEQIRFEARSEALQGQLAILDKEKEQLQETFTVLRMQYEKVLHSEMQHKQNIQDMTLRLSSLESLYEQKQQECQQLHEIRQKLMQAEKELIHVQGVIDTKDEAVRLMTAQNETLRQIRGDLEAELDKRTLELKQAEAAVLQLVEESRSIPAVDPNFNHVESLYKQLKVQFQEKSAVLDQTRRELFAVQEQLSCEKKEREEENIYDISENESLLQREYIKLIKAYENSEKAASAEIRALEDLVNGLLTPPVS